MVAIVEMLRSFCAYVIVDTPAYFNDVVLGSGRGVGPGAARGGMDIPNIKNVKIGLQTLRLLNTPMEKLLLVLNRANSKVKLDVGEGGADPAGQGRRADPQRHLRAAGGQQGRAGGHARPQVRGQPGHPAARRPVHPADVAARRRR